MKFWSLRALNMISELSSTACWLTKLNIIGAAPEYFDETRILTPVWRGSRRRSPPHTERWCLPCEGSSPSQWSPPSSDSDSSLLYTLYPSHDDLARVSFLYQNVDYFPLMLSFNSLKWFIAIRHRSLLVQSNNYQVRTGLERKIITL